MTMNQKCILLVDDEEAVLKVISSHLITDDYRVQSALTGEEAIDKVKKEKPAVVLLDIRLGKMSGIEVLRKIKEIDKTIPVIMVTGVYDNEEGKKAFDAGAVDYVTKPVDFNYLKNVLRIQLL